MPLPSDFASPRVRIEYANMAKVNKIRAWARRNGARVDVSRYTRDAYEGFVIIHAPWNVGRIETDRKVAELQAIINPSRESTT